MATTTAPKTKNLKLLTDPSFPHRFRIAWEDGGEVPQELLGAWGRDAGEKAIRAYIAKKELKAAKKEK